MSYDTESKSRNVLASPLGEEGHEVAKGWTVVRMIMILDVDVTAERRHYNTHRPLKGKRLTTFCASLALLHPLLSLTHWIFRSLMLPYKSSSHSAKCVRCASLRSGGRRLAVRTAMEHPIGALPRTPFPASRDFPSRGNERYEGKNGESYTSCTIPEFPPFGGWRHHLSPASGGTIKRRKAIFHKVALR